MKPVPIKLQERIKWIPFANYLVFPMWAYNVFLRKIPARTLWRSYPWILLACGVYLLLDILCGIAEVPPAMEQLLWGIRLYCFCAVLAHGLIAQQKKYGMDT